MCVGKFIYVDVNPSTRTIDVHEEDAAIAAVAAAAAATATAIDVGIGGIYSPSIMLISEQRNFSFTTTTTTTATTTTTTTTTIDFTDQGGSQDKIADCGFISETLQLRFCSHRLQNLYINPSQCETRKMSFFDTVGDILVSYYLKREHEEPCRFNTTQSFETPSLAPNPFSGLSVEVIDFF
ncbi:hypothetical protein HZH68_004134 [Vespula germanica]|uniref:Uncharacterized protein n=1 Tax=Vespula germanica TaxID=30212 RepID=A0A834KN38_VESGE|nr:hypothetical protein HZH68_004134 [Vespula germanica]